MRRKGIKCRKMDRDEMEGKEGGKRKEEPERTTMKR
jgi:hypothetical protein